jgi:hypothetical protein
MQGLWPVVPKHQAGPDQPERVKHQCDGRSDQSHSLNLKKRYRHRE